MRLAGRNASRSFMAITAAAIASIPASLFAEGPDAEISISQNEAVSKGFGGFGVQWDCKAYAELGVNEEDFALVRSRVEWMRLPLARVMMISNWCYLGDGRYDFETPEMLWLRRQLDLCQRMKTRVLLTDWGCEPGWLKYPGSTRVDDPAYAEIIGTYMERLVKGMGYSCVSHFIFGNEPNCEVKDFDRWKRGLLNLKDEFRKRGLDGIAIAGTDASGGDADRWHMRAAEELGGVIDAYDIHRYTKLEEIDGGKLQDYFSGLWSAARERDPKAASKRMIVGEAGLFVNGFSASNNPMNAEFSYGVRMADYAVQAANSGAWTVSAWMLDDNSHAGFNWGLWSAKKDGMKLKPWFYTWSLLSRLVRPESEILASSCKAPGLRALAARTDGNDWTFCVVNRDAKERKVRVKIPDGPKLSLELYVYSKDSAKADPKTGFPLPCSSLEADMKSGLDLKIPGDGVAILSALR